VIAAFAVLVLMACGGAPEASASAEGSVGASADVASAAGEGGTTAAKPMKVSLEKGWRMQDVISPEDVSAITGKEMKYFAEAAASAKNGRPAAGYTVPGVPYSKIGFRAYVDFGEKEYDIHAKYAVEGTLEEVPGVGDKAYVMDLEDGTRSIVTLVDETVIRISWFAETWPDVDRVEFGSKLANMLIGKITG